MLHLNKLCMLRPSYTCTVRFKSKTPKTNKIGKRFTDTINLPRTDFPLTVKDGAAADRELHIMKVCGFNKLYNWHLSQGRNEHFVLHDGPPYANGKPHVGHAVNKMLKDMINRYKLMRGYRIHYVPGWDCHGLPIELKAITNKTHSTLAPLEIRSKAKKFAENAIKVQREAFQRWGIMADWDKCYFTFNPEYEVDQIEVFYKLFEKGLVYQEYMPVYWSPSSRTALAESELEYNENHVSPSVYVRLPISQRPSCLQDILTDNLNSYVVIWTTTPWTLPINQAVCYHDKIKYVILEDGEKVFVCEKNFTEKLQSILNRPLNVKKEVIGSCFEGMRYINPINNEEMPFLPAEHVITEKGTGFVHTAPAHGHDDFRVALQHNIDMKNMIDEKGCYTKDAGPVLQGKRIGKDAETAVVEILQDNVLLKEDYVHRYPYDWRTNKPVIIRASKQWFINTSKIKGRAVECLKQVKIHPQSSEHGMTSQLETRPYWCVSRQRVWGLPIPVFYNKYTMEPLLNRETTDHIKSLVSEHGSDCWWSMSEEELIPKHVLDKMELSASDFIKGEDILDIWFDSGSSWMLLQKENIKQADVYLEGMDQFRGWFQSSLLTSVALKDCAPYKQLLVHGFTVDDQGQKMSKSLGNVVDPDDVINGRKNRNKYPSFGADVLRWWVAHNSFNTQVRIGQEILLKTNEEIFKMRKLLRHLLGNLNNFSLDSLVPYEELQPLDQYILHLLYQFANQITSLYDNAQFGKIKLTMEKFINLQISSLYCGVTKDRLYCTSTDSHERRSCQTVMYHIISVLSKTIGPILPFMSEEIYQHLPKYSTDVQDSIFKDGWFKLDLRWNNPSISELIEPALSIRHHLNLCVEIDQLQEYEIIIFGSNLLYDNLKKLQQEDSSCSSPLNELIQVSYTHLTPKKPDYIPEDTTEIHGTCTVNIKDGMKSAELYVLIIYPAMKNLCERCRRYTSEKLGTPCDRCVTVMADNWA